MDTNPMAPKLYPAPSDWAKARAAMHADFVAKVNAAVERTGPLVLETKAVVRTTIIDTTIAQIVERVESTMRLSFLASAQAIGYVSLIRSNVYGQRHLWLFLFSLMCFVMMVNLGYLYLYWRRIIQLRAIRGYLQNGGFCIT